MRCTYLSFACALFYSIRNDKYAMALSVLHSVSLSNVTPHSLALCYALCAFIEFGAIGTYIDRMQSVNVGSILELCAGVIKLHVYRVRAYTCTMFDCVCVCVCKQTGQKHAAYPHFVTPKQTSIIFYLIINSQLCINRRQATALGFQGFDIC